jgi:arylsulfatase A-like enzyme
MWEGGLRVPSLMIWPGMLSEGSICDFQSGTVDYFPTILDILKLKPKDKRPMDGVSLMPVLEGTMQKRPIPIASGYRRLYRDTDLYALIAGRYKICIPDKGEKMQLYDLDNDPYETRDLSKTEPEILEKLTLELENVKKSWRLSRDGQDYTF